MIEYYKGFSALIDYHEKLGLFTGYVFEPEGINLTVSASTLDDLLIAYRKAVDERFDSNRGMASRAVA